MSGFNWTCPYCNHAQAITDRQHDVSQLGIDNDQSKYGTIGLRVLTIRCANLECLDLYLQVTLYERERAPGGWRPGKIIRVWNLLPNSAAKPQPDYIPEPLRQDYLEACLIRDLSPKASATLARRCLQGMIRDFCGITKRRLVDEIRTLREQIEAGKGPQGVLADSAEAIDHVREVGNIGAHMEADINLIVDVDPGEAQTLIELIELLFEEWYVRKRHREDRLDQLKAIAGEKKAARNAPKADAAKADE